MEVLKRAYELADQIEDYDYQVLIRYEYISESIFHGDSMMAYVVFPELLRIHDKGVAKGYEEPYTYHVMIAYKWIVGGVMN